MFIVPAGKFTLFHYSSKKELIIPSKKPTYSIIPPHKMALFPFFLLHFFLFTPKIEPGTVSLLESESTIILFVVFSYSATGW